MCTRRSYTYTCKELLYCLVFFFFQAEDGIRDRNVTGVQTCALPISRQRRSRRHKVRRCHAACLPKPPCPDCWRHPGADRRVLTRSEERRVGKECRSRWATSH